MTNVVCIMNTVIFVVLLCYANIICVQTQRQLSLEDSLIIGGKPASIRQYPYAVSVSYKIAMNRSSMCAGTILNTKYVLTAGHCLARGAFNIRVSVGTTMVQQGTFYNATIYKVHPLFNITTVDYDVALVVTETAMVLDGLNTKSVLLTTEATVLTTGSIATVIGWGLRNVHGTYISPNLQEVQGKIVNPEVCNKLYTPSDHKSLLTARMFCIGDLIKGGKNSCYGDSGGPAIDSSGVQIGIVSWGVICARPEFPVVYTNLANPSIRSWIRSETGV